MFNKILDKDLNVKKIQNDTFIKNISAMNYTLITGASKGIGKSLALECAKRKMNLILVARSEDLLKQLAAELAASGIDVKYFVADLLQANAQTKIFEWVRENKLQVNMLINNAGMGYWGKFADCPMEKHLEVMNLNMDAMVKLSYAFLQNTTASEKRYILHTVSTGAYQPVPYMGIYCATKSFMLSFSIALREELKSQNVNVTALCPGPTESEFFGPAKMEKLVARQAKFMMPSTVVARVGMDALLKNRPSAIPGWMNKISALLTTLTPSALSASVSAQIFKGNY